MAVMIIDKLPKVGDTIQFRAAVRSGFRTVRREVTKTWPDGTCAVTKYHGWENFVVYPLEIHGVVVD